MQAMVIHDAQRVRLGPGTWQARCGCGWESSEYCTMRSNLSAKEAAKRHVRLVGRSRQRMLVQDDDRPKLPGLSFP